MFDEDLLKQARTIIFTNAGKVPAREIERQLKTQLATWGHGHVGTIVRTNTARAYNDGRMDEFESVGDLIEAYQYSSFLDGETTVYCTEHHGQIISKKNTAFGSVQTPNHYQCRSMWEAIFAGEPWKDNWNVGCSVCSPQVGFGGTTKRIV